MKLTFVLLLALNSLNAIDNGHVYLAGTSLNTKGVSNSNGVNASETTAHSLDDVTQSKAYASGDDEVNARTNAQTVFVNTLQGVNSDSNAIQTGQGNALADSWSKSFTPTREYYLNNYYSYLQFLNALHGRPVAEDVREELADRINGSIANYENPDLNFDGNRSFDLQQGRASGNNTFAHTNSQTFNWGQDNTMQKGNAVGSANNGWATSNNANWAHNRTNYNTVNKNSAAFGNQAYSSGDSNLYHSGQGPYQSGNAWGQANGPDAVSYSNLNNNSFGYGALSGGSNTYSDGVVSQSVSEYRGNPYGPQN